MKDHRIPRITAKILIPFILLFALYVQFHGDFGPGGGFQAGVIFGAAFILHSLIFGVRRAREVFPPRLLEIGVATGALLYAGVGVVTMLNGGQYLNYDYLDIAHPIHSQHLGILLVELGVGITVSCVMITIFLAFAARGRRKA